MTHPDTSDLDLPDDADEVDPDAEALADHDAGGTELASRIAATVQHVLPPARGVKHKKRPRKRRTVDPNVRSGAGPDERDPELLGAALDQMMTEQGWTTQLNVRSLLVRWAALVGPVNAEHSHPEAYQDRELTIRCESTVWATSLRQIAPQLVAEFNRRLGQGSVTRIIVLGPIGPSWKAGIRSVRDGRGPRDTYG